MYEFARRDPANVEDAVQLLLQITAAQEKDLPLLSTRVDYVETRLEYLTKYGHFSDQLKSKSNLSSLMKIELITYTLLFLQLMTTVWERK